jgi:cytidylate kinase
VKKLIIAIDGPVASGKSTIARRVAELLGYLYLDSGAMYRAVALAADRGGVPLDDAARLEVLAREGRIELAMRDGKLRVLLDGEDVTEAIRSPEISQAASRVAEHAGVRKALVAAQRQMGAAGGVVMEGRDIGTAVFPNAGLKIYLDASLEERARRRMQDHVGRGEKITLEELVEQIRERDRRDRTREVSPLVQAADAVLVDSTALDIEETARVIALLACERAAQ